MSDTIVFDVNETLLDLGALGAPFAKFFGDPDIRGQWFSQVLQSAMVATILGNYKSFAEIARAALEIIAERCRIVLDDHARSEILGTLRALPPHPDVREALARLKTAGFRVAALTNSAPVMIDAQLKNANLSDMFDAVLTVDSVQKFKPAREVYDMAASQLGAEPAALWMVASHNWDTTGAINAGWKAAFVARQGNVLGPLDAEPQIIGKDLGDVVNQLIAMGK